MTDMHILCSDLEGVFVPEIWINVAIRTGIEELKLTTRDIPDYHVLMKKRLDILDRHNLKLSDIQNVIEQMDPLDGAFDFLEEIRADHQIIVVSDTFVEFAGPLMKKLNNPTLFCNSLEVDSQGRITGYRLRQEDGKTKTVRALKSLNFKVVAFGDSYNDIGMLKQADAAILFKPPENIASEFPQFPVTHEYHELKRLIEQSVDEI